MYKLFKEHYSQEITSVTRLVDGASIPFDEANTDYQEYLAWLAEGGVVEEADD
jgi:ABC-type metal ion transport system substrate-binding protein